MKLSGFTIIRNAVLMDYPIVESIKSLLPLVDELVVGVGQGDDGTKEKILEINDAKIKVFDSHWDTNKQKGGLILSEKTNEALARCANDWCIYLQADEVLHEDDYTKIRSAVERANNKPQVQGLLFDYVHFYGSHNVMATARNWYRREIRIIRKSSGAQSVGDAQGFRINGEKLKVLKTGARIFHYGWVKPPESMRTKKKMLDRWWHGHSKDSENDSFDYQRSYGLKEFKGVHPKVMVTRIQKQNWTFNPKMRLKDWDLKNINFLASDLFEKTFGFRIGEYKNYRLIKE